MNKHMPKRLLALFLASVTLLSTAAPALAMDDLSGIGGLPDIVDAGGEIVNIGSPDTTVTPNEPVPDDSWEDSSSEDESSSSSADESQDERQPPESESSSSEAEAETLPAEDQQQAASEPTVGASGLDPPDGYSFPVAMDSGFSFRSRASGSTTIYMQKDSSIQHRYPFSGGNLQPAYIFTTADGKAAYCIEPARWNSVNGDVVTGSQTFSGLSGSQQKQIARAIAASGGSAGNHAYYMACQAIIWEIAYGQSHGSGSVYDAVVAANASKLSSAYHDILSKMEAGGEIPSFMSPDPRDPTIHEMTGSDGSYSIDLTNSNASVKLNAGDFKSKAPFKFSVSGDTLTVTSSTAPDADAYVEWHSNEQSGSSLIFWSGGRQAKATLVGGSVPGDGYMAFFETFNPPTDEGDGDPPPPEEPGLGYLTIYKYDGKTNLPLAGAIFKIESPEYVNDAFELPYGGKTVVIPIPAGQEQVDVTVTETRAPDGYVMDTEPKTVTVTKNETVNIAEVSFVNMPEECSLTIVKHETGNSGVRLPGARFRIRYADVNVSAQVWTETTDANGEIHIQLPFPGTLVIEELEAPAGYVIGAIASHTVTVARGEDKKVEISNDKKSQLIVVKKDNQTGQVLAGATIKATLLRSNTQPHEAGQVFTQTTGPDGRAVFSNLIPGEYRVEESAPPQYYVGTDVVHNVNIPEGNSETITLEFRNEPWTGLTIKKVDATNDKGLQGAIFKLYKGSYEDSKAYMGDWESNENGVVTIQHLDPGYYTIVESQPPYGYLLDEEHHVQTIEVKPDAVEKNMTVIFRNPPKPKILIEKIDAKTGVRLPGAVFHISKKDSIEYEEVTTGEDGTVLVENLDDEWYTITEIRAPSGYVLDDAPKNVQAVPGKTVTVTFKDNQQPDLLLRKIDEATNEGIGNAVFRVTKDGAKEFIDVTTGADGTFLVKDLEPGWYIVTEIQAPEGYILDATPHYIEVIGGQDSELVITNRHKPSLKIVKLDETTKQPLQFAKFRVSIKNGKVIGEYATDASGMILLEDIDPELYVIEEIAAPNGYIIMDGTKEALVEWGKTTVVEFYNQPVNPLLIKKVDCKTGEPLEAAKFLVTKVNGEFVGEYETGRNGFITVTGLDPGFYTVKETKSPLGYILDDTPKTVELKMDEPAVVEFEDEPLNGLHIKKIDSLTKEPLQGAKFRVSEKEGRLIGEFESDAQGEIMVNGLQPGWYTIEEIAAPDGYVVDETPKDVEFVWGQFINVEFLNSRKAPLQIKKVDAKTGAPLEGAKFRVETVEGKFIGEYATDRSGFFGVEDLLAGWYKVTEIEAPQGYRIDETPRNVEVVLNKPAMLEISNELLSPLQVKKVDAETGSPLSGALFRVTKANGEYVGEFTTGADGFINVPELSPGHYIVSEIKAPEGYKLDETPKTVEVKANIPTLAEFHDQRLPGLQVIKLDAVTGEPLEGARFKVEKMNGERVGEFKTNNAGFFVLSDLEPGWYNVFESRAPEGYQLDSTPQSVELKRDKTATLEFEDKPLVGMKIKKVDSVTGKPLKGVEFKITRMDQTPVGTFTTGGDGMIFVPEMKEGWYLVTETKTLSGYKLDAAPRTVEIKAGELNVVEYKNTPYPVLSIKKVDAETGKIIPGVKFKLFDKNSREMGTFQTNQLGLIQLTGMDAGKYYVQETAAAEGYALDTTVRELTLYWGKTTSVEVKNTPLSTLRVKKIDSISKKPLMGAVFNLYDLKNNLLGEYTTDSNGIIEFPREIKAGKYRIKETKAPANYVLDDTLKTIEVKQGETTEIVVENQPVMGQIQIVKTAADDNPITRKKAGAALEGAEFEIYNERLEVVDTITTDARGIANSKDLPVGTYGIKEVRAPEFYSADGKVFYAQIRAAKDLIRFEVQNQSQDIQVSVEKRGNVEVVAGDQMRYDFRSIQNKSNIDLEDFYWHDQLPAEVRLERIYTGAWSQKLSYRVLYKTNHKKDYKVLAEKLSTQTETELDCTKEALRLAADEYVTDVKFEFGTVEPGFHETEPPHMVVTTLPDLPDQHRITNRTDVGGRTGNEWIYARDTWITVAYGKPKGKLPQTGF